MSRSGTIDPTSRSYALRQKGNVMKAVMLRDMRTRFFDHGLGFLLVSFWPLGHLLILLMVYNFFDREAPYGGSLNMFFATGLIPTLSFMYVSRFMSYSLLFNWPMLAFPAVKPTDILFGRAALEIIAACLTAAMTFGLLLMLGDNPVPHDMVEAVYAFLATLLLAVGVGMLVGVLSMMFNFLVTAYALFLIIVYILSGTLFVPAALPSRVIEVLEWNPVLHGVEWMRIAYFRGYPDQVLDKTYLLAFGMVSLFLGLALERIMRRKLLEK